MDETQTDSAPLVTSEPEFQKLRPELRERIETAEKLQRVSLLNMLQNTLCMPENLVSQLYEPVVIAVPREFMRSLLELLQEINAALNHAEMIGRLRSRAPVSNGQVN